MAQVTPKGRRVYRGRHVIVHMWLNRAGIAEIAMSPPMRSAVREVAGDAKSHAQSLAQEFRDTGRYSQSLHVEDDEATLPKRYPMRRVVANLVADVIYASKVEYGYGEGRGHRVLGRTLEHLNAVTLAEAAARGIKLPRQAL